MTRYTLKLSISQILMMRDMLVDIGEKKMMHVPADNGERVAVPLPVEVLDRLAATLGEDEDEPQLIQYQCSPMEGGGSTVLLSWRDQTLDYIVGEDEYALQ